MLKLVSTYVKYIVISVYVSVMLYLNKFEFWHYFNWELSIIFWKQNAKKVVKQLSFACRVKQLSCNEAECIKKK